MAGSKIGGKHAAITNKAKYGEDFYSTIGRIGGLNSNSGGFGDGEAGRLRAQRAGAIGGSISRRDVDKMAATATVIRRNKYLPKNYECTFCKEKNNHKAVNCEARLAYINYRRIRRAKKAYVTELEDLDRDRMQAIARKYKPKVAR